MRALLIANPRATATTPLARDVIVHALTADLDLRVVETTHRGHASELAAEAAAADLDVVVTLGGDGTVNEAVNGLLAHCVPADSAPRSRGPGARPGVVAPRTAIAPIPGGAANVFARALGLPADPVEATGTVLHALLDGRRRVVGLGHANSPDGTLRSPLDHGRYFTFCAGVGLDAEVVRAVEGQRAAGRRASAALYVTTTLRRFLLVSDRSRPALSIRRPGHADIDDVFVGIVSNTAPWTYLGHRPVNPNPRAGFHTGLDLFALRRLRTVATLRTAARFLSTSGERPRGRAVVSLHDEPELTVTAIRPVAVQLDGEYLGETESVTFRAVPDALRVVV